MKDVMNKTGITKIFRGLGIPVDSGKLYLNILRHGHCLITDLVSENSYVEQDLLDKLNWLHRNGLVFLKLNAQQRQEVEALDPRIVARSFYSRFLWRHVPLEEMLSSQNQKKQELLNNYHELCRAMEKILYEVYRPQEVQKGLTMFGSEEASNALAKILSEAHKEILGITVPPWEPDVALIWETLKDRMSNGIKYKRICDEVTFISFGHLINKRDVLQTGVNLKVLNHQHITDKFYVVDRSSVFVIWPSATTQDFSLEATHITTRTLVDRYVKTFEKMWRKGMAAKKLILEMEEVRASFVSRCRTVAGDNGEQLGKNMFDYGKFCRVEHSGIMSQPVQSILSLLAENSLLIPLEDSELGFIPNTIDEVRSKLRD